MRKLIYRLLYRRKYWITKVDIDGTFEGVWCNGWFPAKVRNPTKYTLPEAKAVAEALRIGENSFIRYESLFDF